jgi:DNA-binding MarR family transcriptional regulator
MKKYGLRGAYALYLMVIGSSDGQITVAKLAELCRRDKADVSRAIASFQEKGIGGLVSRHGCPTFRKRFRKDLHLPPGCTKHALFLRQSTHNTWNFLL